MFFNRELEPLPLHDLYKGSVAFVVGGGRSITPNQLEILDRPGIVTAALNEPAHYIRPDIFYCSDLHEIPLSILSDPKIMKFFPHYTADKTIYEDRISGKLIRSYPNVIQCRMETKSFSRHGWVNPKFLFRQKGPDEKYTPFSAIILFNLLYKLGFREIYLVGYDFSDETNRCTYFYDRSYIKGTGRGIAKIRDTLEQLVAIEDEFKIYNCSPRSGLTFFEYKDLEQAIKEQEVQVDADIFERSTQKRFNWYLKNRLPKPRKMGEPKRKGKITDVL